ncbi:YraN family protein [Nostocales cyanobacterium HT-58-2]|nr:YraN family protein [Nostocales cyanobacterium HT-58-2]
MPNYPQYHYPDIGIAGEDLVAQWLQSKGWVILHRRWRYRQGEIDIIAQYDGQQRTRGHADAGKFGEEFSASPLPFSASSSSGILAFVEVKTRSRQNWDAGGRNAITKHKQTKLWKTALMFLAKYPEKADYPCRFDVAIVYCEHMPQRLATDAISQEVMATSSVGKNLLMLQEYIPAAFDS